MVTPARIAVAQQQRQLERVLVFGVAELRPGNGDAIDERFGANGTGRAAAR